MQKVLITGGTGLLGQALLRHFQSEGVQVNILSTRASSLSAEQVYDWNPAKRTMNMAALQGVDCIIHLAGSPVAKRWTARHFQSMHNSRVGGALTLKEAIAKLPEHNRPQAIISASAVGIYRNDTQEIMSTQSDLNTGRLALLVKEWEDAVQSIESLGLRTVSIRLGLILSRQGGFFNKLLPAYRLGLGTYIGSGQYPMPWIHVDDAVRLFTWASKTVTVQGILPGTAPHSATMKSFHSMLGNALNMRQWLPPAPMALVKIALGDMAQILDSGQLIDTSPLKDQGFQFHYDNLNAAIDELLGSG